MDTSLFPVHAYRIDAFWPWVWFVFFLIVPHYQKRWVFPTGDFTFIRGLILNTYQDALAQQTAPLYTFYNFPLTLYNFIPPPLLLLFLPLLPPLPVLPWQHCQLCTGPVSLIRWSCRIISLPPSQAPFYFLSSQGGSQEEAEGTPSPHLLPLMLSNHPTSFPLSYAHLSVNSVRRIKERKSELFGLLFSSDFWASVFKYPPSNLCREAGCAISEWGEGKDHGSHGLLL